MCIVTTIYFHYKSYHNWYSRTQMHWKCNTVKHFFFFPGALPAFQHFISGDHWLIEFDHECRALVPVDSDLGREAAVGEDSLHDTSSEGCTVQRAVFFWNRDKHVYQWFLFNNVVGLVIIISLLQFVRLFPKQGFPDGNLCSKKLRAKWRSQMLKII